MNFATATAEELAAAGFVTKQLKQRGPRKGELMTRQSQHGAGRAYGSVNSSSEGATGATTCGGGAGMNLNKVYGIGASKVENLAAVQSRYARQAKADRRAFVLGL